MNLLNHGFFKLLNCHAKQLKKIKAQLPRRESERRNHALSKHSDVLTCIETRLSMLSMTYQKYIQNGTACFIPGKVIDECYKILRSISSFDTRNLRAHEILQELRDISSMAIEHFDEKIVPEIKKSRPDAGNVSISSIYDLLITTPRAQSFEGLAFNLSRNSSSSSVSHKEEHGVKTKSKISSVIRLYKKQSKIIKSQAKQISTMFKNMKQMKRRLDETEIKNREMTESIKQLKATAKPREDDTAGRAVKKRTATMVLKRRLDEWNEFIVKISWVFRIDRKFPFWTYKRFVSVCNLLQIRHVTKTFNRWWCCCKWSR